MDRGYPCRVAVRYNLGVFLQPESTLYPTSGLVFSSEAAHPSLPRRTGAEREPDSTYRLFSPVAGRRAGSVLLRTR